MKDELAEVRRILKRPTWNGLSLALTNEPWRMLADAVKKLLTKFPTAEDIAILEALRASLVETYKNGLDMFSGDLVKLENQIAALDRVIGTPALPALADWLEERIRNG